MRVLRYRQGERCRSICYTANKLWLLGGPLTELHGKVTYLCCVHVTIRARGSGRFGDVQYISTLFCRTGEETAPMKMKKWEERKESGGRKKEARGVVGERDNIWTWSWHWVGLKRVFNSSQKYDWNKFSTLTRRSTRHARWLRYEKMKLRKIWACIGGQGRVITTGHPSEWTNCIGLFPKMCIAWMARLLGSESLT